MSTANPSGHEPHTPGFYQIRLQGHLDPRWASWFASLEITHRPDGETLISGPVQDQAALHGLLRKVRDLGLPLIAVYRLSDDLPEPPVRDPSGGEEA